MRNAITVIFLIFLLVLSLSSVGCGETDSDESDSDDDATPADDDNDDTDQPDPGGTDDDDDEAPECDNTRRPLVFAHGFLEDGDAFSTQAMRFASNGYCLDRIFTFDWNTLWNFDAQPPLLEKFIDEALALTGADQVDLMGHSMGGALSYYYLQDEKNVSKVAHYANLASFTMGENPPDLPIINISSEGDTMAGVSEISGAENVEIDGLDHLQVATSEQTFAHLFRFFNDGEQAGTTQVQPEEAIELSGKAVVIALNSPVAKMEIQVFAFDPETGERQSPQPIATVTTDAQGAWGPIDAQPGVSYEFVCLDPAGILPPVHYYREPFPRSNNKIYFRVLPDGESMLGRLLGFAPFNDNYALLAWLNVNQAVIAGRDTFFVNGIDLATDAIADPENTTLGVFFFDANFNGVSDEAPAGGIFSSIIFLRFFDLLIGTETYDPIVFEFNGRTIAVPNWKSRTEGVSIAVFE